MTCMSCPLGQRALVNCMRSPSRADVMVVLSNPSGEDDLAGGFVPDSRVGNMLRQVMEAGGYRDGEYFVTFATRCAAGRDNPPTLKDVDACRTHMIDEIREKKPKTIIAFGNDAFKSLCKKSGIKENRGKAFPLHADFDYSCEVNPTYAITDIFRVPNFKSVITSDIRRLRDASSAAQSVPWTYYQTGTPLPPAKVVAWDIESIDAEGNYTDYPTQVSAAGEDWVLVSTIEEANVRGMLERIAASQSVLVAHNGWNFDEPMVRKGGIGMPMGEDTMALAYYDDETQPLKLESLAVKYLGVKGWKDEFGYPLGSDGFAEYNAKDTRYLHDLYSELVRRIGSRKRTIDLILKPAQAALHAQTARGIFIDQSAVEAVRVSATAERDRLLLELRGLAGPSFNPGSTKQLAKFLQSQGVVLPPTKTGKPATGSDVLENIQHPACSLVLAYRSAVKTLGTYVKPYAAIAASEDKRVHPTYNLVRTLTGRTSARDLNIQNLDRELKGFFGAPPGHVLVSADYNAIEFRVAAWCAQELGIIERYKQDPLWDPHRYFASKIFGVLETEVTKQQRQTAKSCNFSLLFLGNEFNVQKYAKGLGVDLSMTFCAKATANWHDTFPGFRKFYHETKEELIHDSQVRTATGHIRHFGDFKVFMPKMRVEALRQAVNTKVQGLAAHIALVAAAELERRELPVVGFIHDAFLFDFDSFEEYEARKEEIDEVMCKYPITFLKENFDVDFSVPLAAEHEVKHGR